MKSLMLSIAVITALALGAADPGCIIEDNSENPHYPKPCETPIVASGTAHAFAATAVDIRSFATDYSEPADIRTDAPGLILIVR